MRRSESTGNGELDLELREFLLEFLAPHLAKSGLCPSYVVRLLLVSSHLPTPPCHYPKLEPGDSPMILEPQRFLGPCNRLGDYQVQPLKDRTSNGAITLGVDN